MAEFSLRVNQTEIENVAKTVHTESEKMLGILEKIKDTVNNLSNSWASEAGEEIRAAITNMQKRFEQYRDVTESYSQFLYNTAKAYAETESELKSMASDFKM